MISALLCCSRLDGNAILSTLPYILKKQAQDEIYKHYVASAVGGLAGIKVRYSDLISFKKADTRTAEEIVADTIAQAGLVVENNECF